MKKKRGKKTDFAQNTVRLSERGWNDLFAFKEFVDEAMHADGHPRGATLAVTASMAMAHAVASVDGTAFARNAKSVEAEIVEGVSRCILDALREALPGVDLALKIDLATRHLTVAADQQIHKFELPMTGGEKKISMRQ